MAYAQQNSYATHNPPCNKYSPTDTHEETKQLKHASD